MPETDTATRLHAAQKRVEAARKGAWDARYANSVIRTRSVNALTEAVRELNAAEEAAKEATVQAPAEPAKSLHPDTQREVDLTYDELLVARKALGTARAELLRAVMSNVPEVAAAARAARRATQHAIEQLEEVERLYRESGAVRTSTEEGK